MPTPLDVPYDELTSEQKMQVVDDLLRTCSSLMKELPLAKPIADLANPRGSTERNCVTGMAAPLTGSLRCFDFGRVTQIPYMDGDPDPQYVHVVCLGVDGTWFTWTHHQTESPNPLRIHSFESLKRDWLIELLGVNEALLFAIIAKLTKSVEEARKRALARFESSVVMLNQLVELHEGIGLDTGMV